MDPITNGDYPFSMKVLVGDRLPKFSEHQSAMLKGSYDFVGLDYYTARYVADASFDNSSSSRASYLTDAHAQQLGKPKSLNLPNP